MGVAVVVVHHDNERESLVCPQDYKFAADPAPFTFECCLDGRPIARLVGHDTSPELAETADQRGKLLDWLRAQGPATKTAMKKAGFSWATLGPLVDGLLREGLIDAGPGPKKGSTFYFVVKSEPSSVSEDDSPHGRHNAA